MLLKPMLRLAEPPVNGFALRDAVGTGAAAVLMGTVAFDARVEDVVASPGPVAMGAASSVIVVTLVLPLDTIVDVSQVVVVAVAGTTSVEGLETGTGGGVVLGPHANLNLENVAQGLHFGPTMHSPSPQPAWLPTLAWEAREKVSLQRSPPNFDKGIVQTWDSLSSATTQNPLVVLKGNSPGAGGIGG